MPRTRSLVGPLLVALVAAGGAWLALAPGSDGSDAAGDAALERGRGRDGSADALTGVQLASASAGRAGGPADARGVLRGIVTRGGRPAAARVEAWWMGAEDPRTPLGANRIGAWYRRFQAPDPAAKPLASGHTDADGTFALEGLPRSRVHVVAIADDGTRAGVIAFVSGGTAAGGVHVTLPVLTGTVTGTVRHADGRPWQGFVRWAEYARDWDDVAILPGDAPPVATDAAGRYTLSGAPYGPVALHACLPGQLDVQGRMAWVPCKEPYDIVVDENITWIPARVLSAEDGAAIPGALVVGGVGKVSLRAVSDTEGRARIARSSEAEAQYYVLAPGWSRAQVTVMSEAEDAVVVMSRSGCLKGRVVAEPGGEPLVGVSVCVEPAVDGTGELPAAVSGPDGRFEMADVPAGELELRAQGNGRVLLAASDGAKRTVAAWVPAGGTGTALLKMAQGVAWTGTVRDQAGRPLAGASVIARAPLGQKDAAREVATDAEGRFTLTGVVGGAKYAVEAQAAGFLPQRANAAAGEAPLDLTLDRGRWIQVTVLDENDAPLCPALACGWSENRPYVYAGTGPDGSTCVGPLPCGAPLIMWATTHERLWAREDVPADDAGTGAPLAITLRPARSHSISGSVAWWGGEPAEGVRVSVEGRGESATTQADGTFEIKDVPPGEFEVAASVWSTRRSEAVQTSTLARAGTAGVRLRMPERAPPEQPAKETTATVLLRVLDDRGLPVASASLRVWGPSINKQEKVNAGIARLPVTIAGFEITGAASASGLPLAVARYRGGAPPTGAAETTVHLIREQTISGRVVDGEGAPLSGISLRLRGPVEGEEGWENPNAYTRSDGTFDFAQLTPGTYDLDVQRAAGFLTPAAPLRVRAGDDDVTVALKPAARAVLTVLGPDGAPLSGARVWLTRPGTEPDAEPRTVASGWTDAEGHSSPERLEPGAVYTLSVAASRLPTVCLPHWQPADTVVRLRAGPVVTGTVRDPRGRPQPGATVWGRHADETLSTQTDEEGAFLLEGLPPGRAVMFAAFRRANDDPWLPAGAEVLSETTSDEVTAVVGDSDVRLVLDPGLPISVHVTGLPKNVRAQVRLARIRDAEDEDSVRRPTWGADLDASGDARFFHAPAGAQYALLVGPLPDGRVALEKRVRPGPHTVEVTLAEGGRVEGTMRVPIADWNGRVHADVEGFEIGGTIDPDGWFQIRGVPPGEWTLFASAWTPGVRNAKPKRFAAKALAREGQPVELRLEAESDSEEEQEVELFWGGGLACGAK